MTPQNTYVVSRLNVWSSWRIRHDEGGLGYPSKSAFAKDSGAGFWTPEMDSGCYEMDQCVVALKPELKTVILLEFTKTGIQEQKAKIAGCCLATYKNRLGYAYNELLGLLNDSAAGIRFPAPETKLNDSEKCNCFT